MNLKVVSYNMYKGKKAFSNRYIFDKMVTELHAIDADVLLIQEFLGKNLRAGRDSDEPIARLRSDLYGHYAYGMNSRYKNGEYGNIILSKFPIVESENIDISQVRFAKRGLLYAKIEVPTFHSPIHLMCCHLDLFAKARVKQMDQIFERIDSFTGNKEPFILAGDFNDWNRELDKKIQKRLKRHYGDNNEAIQVGKQPRTYPSMLPLLPLDRFYYYGIQGGQIEVVKGRPWNQMSDHLPLTLSFSLD